MKKKRRKKLDKLEIIKFNEGFERNASELKMKRKEK
jgi:hypothetical protein